MNDNISIAYKIHRFTSSKETDFIKGLNIYSSNIEYTIRTNTNEIIYWLDNYNKQFPDSFYVFGLYQNKELIGFTQLVLFKKEGILMIDYMVIEKPYRGNSTFFVFTAQIRNYFNNFELNFIITEIVYNSDGVEPCEKSKNLIRLLKISHFKIVKAPYYQPQLGLDNIESEMRALIMIYNNGEINKIKSETYVMLIKTLYYNHYFRWYKDFLTEDEQTLYKNGLEKLFNNINSEVSKKEYILLNGHHHLQNEPIEMQPKKVNLFLVIVSVVFLFLLLFLGLISLHLFLKNKCNIETSAQISIFTASLLGCTIFLAYLYKRNENFINKLLDKFFK